MYTILSSRGIPLMLPTKREKMPSAIAQLGLQGLSQAISGGMGLLLGGINDRRQLRQQEKLQQLQIAGQKEMSDYNYRQQMRMWGETNYQAQVEQMKKAGINPGLLLGMGGAGGTTTGSQGGNISGATAQQNPGEVQAIMGMGLQGAMQAAQIKLLNAQAENVNADTKKKQGVDTQEAQARIESILQGVDNQRQQYEISKLEIAMKNIENYEKQATQEDRLEYIEYQTKIAIRNYNIIANEQKISDATIYAKIAEIKAEAIGASLKNELTKTQTSKTASDIKINEEQLNQWVQSNMREWDKISQENRRIRVMELMQQWNTDPVVHATDQISRVIDNIFMIGPKLGQGQRTVIEGFNPQKKY